MHWFPLVTFTELGTSATIGGFVLALTLAIGAGIYKGCVMFYEVHKLIQHELKPNGGNSMKDVANRQDQRLDEIETAVNGIDTRLKVVEVKVDGPSS